WHGGIGQSVVNGDGEALASADTRPNRDDAPAFLHERSCGPNGSSDAAHIDRKEAVELGKIVGTVMHLIGREHAGIVDQNVEAAEALVPREPPVTIATFPEAGA